MPRRRIVPFFITHSGCRHRCIFCNQETVAPCRTIETVAEEVSATLGALGAGSTVECAFYGGTFSLLPPHQRRMLLDAVRPFRQRGVVLGIRISTRPDSLDDAMAVELSAAGVDTVEIGAQSMDDTVLRSSRRGHTAADVEAARDILARQGLSVGIQLMPGLPGESFAGAIRSMERVLALKPDFIRIYPTLVLKGTGLAALHGRGAYEPLSLQRAIDLCKHLLVMAYKARIPVIRMGVQPSEFLDAPGTVLAGPYHPAFRQLVESALFRDALLSLLPGAPSDCLIHCHPSRVSDLAGQHRSNLHAVRQAGHNVRIAADVSCSRDEIILVQPIGPPRVARVMEIRGQHL